MLAALSPVAAILIAWPVAEISFNDDWSYAWTAKRLFETGRLEYGGFAEPLVGVQAVWGAIVIGLLGFSFTALRLSMAVWASATSLLCFALGKRAGLTPQRALFAALCVMLSPLVLPLSASFMTDLPAMGLALACVYSAEQAAVTARRREVIGWLCLCAITGLAAGSVRQVMWIAPVLCIGYVAIRRRNKRALVYCAIAICLLTIGAAAWMMAWINRQPYVPDAPGLHVSLGTLARVAPKIALRYALGATAILLPASLWYLWHCGTSRATKLSLCAIAAIGCALAAWSLGEHALFPWTGNIITRWGVLMPNVVMLGTGPRVMPLLAVYVASFVGATTLLFLLWKLPHYLRSRPFSAGIVFALAYMAVIVWRVTLNLPMDRYLAPALPFLAIALMQPEGTAPSPRWRISLWLPGAALLLVAGYSICVTHDAYALRRAIVAAVDKVQSAGVDRRAVSGGLEFDAWTQLAHGRFLNTPGLNRPENAYRVGAVRRYGRGMTFYYGSFLPAVEPRYFVLLSPHPDLDASEFPPVEYRCWLPPHRRRVVIQTGLPMSKPDS